MNICRITDRLSYIEASEDPLSADVGIVKGDRCTWLFDTGSSDEVAEYLQSLPGEKQIVISHFHPDHMANLERIAHAGLYVGDNTFKYTKSGQVVSKDLELSDGCRIHIFPIPSSHAKGSLGLEIDGEVAFLGDATYTTRKGGQIVYNAQLLLEEIRVLKNLKADTFLLSHRKGLARPAKEVLAELEEIYSMRQKNNPYIPV